MDTINDYDQIDPEEATAFILSVYSDVWKDYFEWDRNFSVSQLDKLCNEDVLGCSDDYTIESLCETVDFTSCWQSQSTLGTGVRIDCNGDLSESSWQLAIVAPSLPEFSPYEYCNPLVRNEFLGDDPEPMPFVPFPDEPDFNLTDYQNLYKSFAWKMEASEPDGKLVL